MIRYILDAFAKLREETVIFVIPVHLSLRPRGKVLFPLDGFC